MLYNAEWFILADLLVLKTNHLLSLASLSFGFIIQTEASVEGTSLPAGRQG